MKTFDLELVKEDGEMCEECLEVHQDIMRTCDTAAIEMGIEPMPDYMRDPCGTETDKSDGGI